ncbi:MAG: choice-of-anchor T family protein [Candidatus Poseidoniaceae archaeon]
MHARFVIIIMILSFCYLPVSNSQAQIGPPDVNLECSPTNIGIDVYPGADLTGFTTCTVSNPNSYQEKIEIEVNAEGLQVAAPGSITLGANEEQDFDVLIRAFQRMPVQSRDIVVKATVTEVMGAPPPTLAEKEEQLVVEILQFAEVQVEAPQPVILLNGGSEFNAEFNVINLGNNIDLFRYDIDSESLKKMEDEGFIVSLVNSASQIENSPAPTKVRVLVQAPNDNPDWEINEDGVRAASFQLKFVATSDFSCNVGDCISDDASMTINVIQEGTSSQNLVSGSTNQNMLILGGVGAALIIMLVLLIVLLSKKK